MPPYTLLKNTESGEIKATPYASLEDLRSWIDSELGPSTPAPADNSELHAKIKAILEKNSLGSSPLATAIDALFTSPVDSEGMIREYKALLQKLYDNVEFHFTRENDGTLGHYNMYNKHPEFEHYAFLSSYGLTSYINDETDPLGAQILRDFRDKKLIYKVSPETCKNWGKLGRQFVKREYYNVVKTLFEIYGVVLPELAYLITTSYFHHRIPMSVHKIPSQKYLFWTEQEVVDKAWVNTFIDKFFVRGEGKSMKRSDFIDELNEHFDFFVKNVVNEQWLMPLKATFNKRRAESELFKSPDKVLGLPMVRRAAGMYIVGIAPINEPAEFEEHPTYDKVIEHVDQDIIEWSSLIIHETPFRQVPGFGIANVKFRGNWVSAQIYNGNTILNTVSNEHGRDSFYITSEGRCLPFTGNCEEELIRIRFQAVGPCSFSYDIVSCTYDGAKIRTKDYLYKTYNNNDKINISEPIEEMWVEPSKPLRNVLICENKRDYRCPKHCLTREGDPLYKFFPKCVLEEDAKLEICMGEEDTQLKTFARVCTVLERKKNGWSST